MNQGVEKYRLVCTCGEAIEVQPTQAGLTVTCVCQTQIVVPSVRDLRQLERVESSASAQDREWAVSRHGALVAALILAAVLAALGAWQWYSAPPELLPDKILANVHSSARRLSPSESVIQWSILNDGLDTIDTVAVDEYWRNVRVRRFAMIATWVAAALVAMIGMVYFMLHRPVQNP